MSTWYFNLKYAPRELFFLYIIIFCCALVLLLRGTCRQTLCSSWLHQLCVCTNGFTDFAEMSHFLENVKVWIQYNAAL